MKHRLSYLLCIMAAVVFTLALNGRVGLFLCFMMVIALVLSFLIKMLVSNKIKITVASKTTQVAKGDTIEISFDISKTTWLPTPFIEVCFNSSKNIKAMSPEKFRIALGFSKEPGTYRITYRAEHFGMAHIEVSSVKLIDYLGLFHSDVKTERFESRFGVLPVIHEMSGQNELLRICCDASAYDDNAQEADEAAPIGTGVAGYEHREYVIGDPIKRINWKLSSKRDSLMIRLDEKLEAVSQAIIFDCTDEGIEDEDYYKNRDIIAEGLLAMSALMLRQGMSCVVYGYFDGAWEKLEIEDAENLLGLQSQLADYEAVPTDEMPPVKLVSENSHKVAMLFTNSVESLPARLSQLEQSGCDIYSVIPQEIAEKKAVSKAYSLSDDFEFTSLL